MQKFLHFDWLRACELIPNSADSWNWVQKDEIECKKMKLKMIDSYDCQVDLVPCRNKMADKNETTMFK